MPSFSVFIVIFFFGNSGTFAFKVVVALQTCMMYSVLLEERCLSQIPHDFLPLGNGFAFERAITNRGHGGEGAKQSGFFFSLKPDPLQSRIEGARRRSSPQPPQSHSPF